MDTFIIAERVAEIDALKSKILDVIKDAINVKSKEERDNLVRLANIDIATLNELYEQLFNIFKTDCNKFTEMANDCFLDPRKKHRP